jgi:predicted metal-dependent HD superfamily phosphohydrolase
LEQALNWGQIFRTEFYERELGATARANMAWELEEMQRGRMVRV